MATKQTGRKPLTAEVAAARLKDIVDACAEKKSEDEAVRGGEQADEILRGLSEVLYVIQHMPATANDGTRITPLEVPFTVEGLAACLRIAEQGIEKLRRGYGDLQARLRDAGEVAANGHPPF